MEPSNVESANLTTPAPRNVKFPLEKGSDGEGYLCPTNSRSRRGLVLLQEWWGLNKSIMNMAESFASENFTVLVPDIYRGKNPKDTDEAGNLLSKLDWQDAAQIIGGAASYLLNKQGCEGVGAIGFCMGGALTLAGLSKWPKLFKAGAPFYGICDINEFSIDDISRSCHISLNFAEFDEIKGYSDPITAQILEMTLKNVQRKAELTIWEDVQHNFMNPDAGPLYDKENAEKAKAKVIKFFREHL